MRVFTHLIQLVGSVETALLSWQSVAWANALCFKTSHQHRASSRCEESDDCIQCGHVRKPGSCVRVGREEQMCFIGLPVK